MTIQEYFGDWSKVIDLQEADKIVRKLSNTPNICPELKDIFKAFRLCPYNNLRCVIIGQDPYYTLRSAQRGFPSLSESVPVATGIAFANSSDTPSDSYSPSLAILRDSVMNLTVKEGITNFDPSLEKWEEQGVLLLNAALTCQVGKPGSHMLLWRPFMKSFLSRLSEYATGIVYVLMGSTAESLEPFICHRTNHIIRIRHPSYYARTKTQMPSDLWKQINKLLIGMNGYGIEWC